MKPSSFLYSLVVLLMVMNGVFSQNPPPPDENDTRDLTKYASVDYATHTENLSLLNDRWLKNKRYDGQEWVYKTINNPQAAGVGRIQHLPPPPLFPVKESIIALIGEVVAVKGFLSNDRECVYTEFTIRIEDLLKNVSSLKDPKQVVADREGGVVVYPNGQRIKYESSDRALLQLGSKYILFLIREGESPNYKILRSYGLSRDRVYPLETGLPLDEFKDLHRSAFIDLAKSKFSQRVQ